MKPLGKYIIISQIDEQVKSDIGLIMSGTDTSKMRYKKAEIVKKKYAFEVSDIPSECDYLKVQYSY